MRVDPEESPMRALTLGIAGWAVVLAFGGGMCAGQAAAEDLPDLPGITSPDEAPEGCVSCHKGAMSLKSKLAALKHREIDDKVQVIPDDCKSCHSEDQGLESMAMIAHSMHYASISNSEFITKHKGSCLNCHMMATGSGEVTIKSGAKNW